MTAKTIFTLVSLGVCFTSGAGIYIYRSVFADGLPALFILYGNTVAEAARGLYTWTDYSATDFIGNVPAGLPIKTPLLSVLPQTELRFQFTVPPESVAIYCRHDRKITKQSVPSNSIITPDADGDVFYEVVAYYKHGTVSFAFSTEVKAFPLSKAQ